MRVTFVHPAGYNFVPGKRDVSILINRMAPVGILQLAANLERQGHPTIIHDCLGPHAPRGVARNVEQVLAGAPDLVGFSATTSAFLDACEMAAHIKKAQPDIRIIIGGVHVSAMGAPLLQWFPAIDYLCLGEGEGVIEDLAAGKAPPEIPNLVYREGEQILANPRRRRLSTLDDLPFPAYEKLQGFPANYHLPLFSFVKRYGATMITSRGCPFTCSYCDRTVFERGYTYNSPGYIWEHMRRLRNEFGVHHINFYDDLFTANRQRILELCEMLLKKPLGMDFNCAIRVGHTDVELLGWLKRAGCFQVSMGIESGSPELLAQHKAGVTLEIVRETVDKVHSAKLRAKGLFIFGLPGETPETVRATSDFIEQLGLDELNISKFSPFHGASVWEECSSGKRGSFHEDWRLMNCLHFTYIPEGFQSRHQMDYLYNECIRRFYRGEHYQKLFKARLWQHRWSLWHVLSRLPAFIGANSQFTPKRGQASKTDGWPPPHPLQPNPDQLRTHSRVGN